MPLVPNEGCPPAQPSPTVMVYGPGLTLIPVILRTPPAPPPEPQASPAPPPPPATNNASTVPGPPLTVNAPLEVKI